MESTEMDISSQDDLWLDVPKNNAVLKLKLKGLTLISSYHFGIFLRLMFVTCFFFKPTSLFITSDRKIQNAM